MKKTQDRFESILRPVQSSKFHKKSSKLLNICKFIIDIQNQNTLNEIFFCLAVKFVTRHKTGEKRVLVENHWLITQLYLLDGWMIAIINNNAYSFSLSVN